MNRRFWAALVALTFLASSAGAQTDRRRGMQPAQRYYYSPSAPAAADPEFDDVGFNLVFWLKGDAGTYQTTDCSTTAAVDGQTVKCWADQSGSAFNVSENDTNVARVAGGTQGLTKSFVNNRASGTGKLTLSSASALTLDFGTADSRTMFFRGSVENPTNTNYIIDKTGTGGNVGWDFDIRTNGAGAGKVVYYLGDVGGDYNGVSYGPVDSSTAYEVWVTYNGIANGFTMRFNRASVTPTDHSSGTVNTSTSDGVLCIAGRANGSDADQIYIEEIAVFSRVLTGAEMIAFETGYLTDRYGAM